MSNSPESRIEVLEASLKKMEEKQRDCWAEQRACQARVNAAWKDFEHRISVFEGVWKLMAAIVPLLAGQTIYIILGGGR